MKIIHWFRVTALYFWHGLRFHNIVEINDWNGTRHTGCLQCNVVFDEDESLGEIEERLFT